MAERQIFGLSAALVTPFAADGGVDFRRLAHHARWALGSGCDSLTLFGTTGEGFSIGLRERAAMLGALAGGAADLPRQVYAAVTASALEDAVAQARLALDFGARGLLFTPPFYLKGLEENGLFAWFSRAFEAIGAGLHGVVLYNIPGQTAVPLSVELVARLRDAFPGAIVGVKDSSGDWSSTRAYLRAHGDLAILVGDERHLAAAMREGAQGSICGLANFAPHLLRPAIHAGADDPRVGRLVEAIVAHPILPAIKALVAHRHTDPGYARTRPPLIELAPGPARALAEACDRVAALTGA